MESNTVDNPLEGTPEGTLYEDEDHIWSSQTAHYHLQAQGVRALPDADIPQDEISQFVEDGHLEADPVQVSVRNRQGRPIRVLSEWDGHQLHLDVATTEDPVLSPRAAASAGWRWLVEWAGYTVFLLLALLMAILSTAISVALSL